MFEPLPPRKVLLQAATLLLVVEIVVFGVYLRQMGFYHDDWCFLEQMKGAAGYWARVKLQTLTPALFRPTPILFLPMLYAWAGFEPLSYHVLGMACDWLGAAALYLLLCRLLGRPRLALAAAVFAILHPSHPATHHNWLNALYQPPAQALALGSLVVYTYWLETRRVAWLWAALAAYFVSLLWYEASALLPVMLAPVIFERFRCDDPSWKTAAARTARALAPFGGVMLASMAVGSAVLPWLSGHSNAKRVALSPGWFMTVYRSGLESLTKETLKLCRITARPAFELFAPAQSILWALFTVGSASVLASTDAERRPPPLARAFWVALATFVCAYAPYALSGAYEPQVVGVMSRTNGAGALAAALAMAALIDAAFESSWTVRLPLGPALGAVLAALVIGAFTWTDWYIARQWVEAWTIQNRIMDGIDARKASLPQHAFVMLKAPEHFNGGPLFSASWDFGSAMRLRTGRKDLAGEVVRDGMSSEKEGVVYRAGGRVIQVFPYKDLFMYAHEEGRLYRLAP